MALTLASNAITFTDNTSLSSGIIGTAQLSAGAVTADKIADSSITTQTISNSAITAEKMSGGQIGDAPVYGCRAWVNFNGTLSAGGVNSSQLNQPVHIRASGNVSRVQKLNQVGDYIVFFNTPMQDTNYTVNVEYGMSSGSGGFAAINYYSTTTPLSTNACRIYTWGNTSQWVDTEIICVTIFR